MMFMITQDWLFLNNTDIAQRFLWSKKKYNNDYVRMCFAKLTINENQQEALWEASISFLADKAEGMIGNTLPTEEQASLYVFGAFRNWFRNKIRDELMKTPMCVPINERTIKGDEMIEEKDKTLRIDLEQFANTSEEGKFYLNYLLCSQEEQIQMWDEKRFSIMVLGTKVSKTTFYKRLNAFKAGLKNYLGEQ